MFLPGVGECIAVAPTSYFWSCTASIGQATAPLIPRLGIALVLVAGSTMNFKKLEYGVEIEL